VALPPPLKSVETLKSRHFLSASIRALSLCFAELTASLPSSSRSGGSSRLVSSIEPTSASARFGLSRENCRFSTRSLTWNLSFDRRQAV
jgi:hypothetical protein